MANLEDRRPDAGQRQQVALHLSEHWLGQHGRPGGKVEYTLRHERLLIPDLSRIRHIVPLRRSPDDAYPKRVSQPQTAAAPCWFSAIGAGPGECFGPRAAAPLWFRLAAAKYRIVIIGQTVTFGPFIH
jgi:hypothetical protein